MLSRIARPWKSLTAMSDPVVLVTGASSGIGRATVAACAKIVASVCSKIAYICAPLVAASHR